MNETSASFSFQDMPCEYLSLKEQITDESLKNLYSKFEVKYFNCLNQKYIIEKLLYSFLNDYKFITYSSSISNLGTNEIINSIICVEDKCLIIESIDNNSFNDIIKKVKSDCIDINPSNKTKTSTEIYEEIASFCHHFQKIIKNNSFLKYTIRPLVAYIIRRYFYPSNYFNNSSFFNFENTAQKNFLKK